MRLERATQRQAQAAAEFRRSMERVEARVRDIIPNIPQPSGRPEVIGDESGWLRAQWVVDEAVTYTVTNPDPLLAEITVEDVEDIGGDDAEF